MESRFGHDFSGVRIHTDAQAAESARALNALAYTVGRDIVFDAGRYSPRTSDGQKLIAHELAHVVQQEHGSRASTVQRQTHDRSPLSDAKEWAEEKAGELKKGAEDIATLPLKYLANKPSSLKALYEHKPCPPTFCQPFEDKIAAAKDLERVMPLLLAGIAIKVKSRVIPLWAAYLSGGSSVKDLSGDFGADFTASRTTAKTTTFLLGELRKYIEANHVSLMGDSKNVTLDFNDPLKEARKAISTQESDAPMDFNYPTEIAGNIAGGIGNDQTAYRIGNKPSPANDARLASISATLWRMPNGTIAVQPSIKFVIQDTIDLCPGNCGEDYEQVATIPLSRFEATGLVGDVPFIVSFPAPPALLSPFVLTLGIPTPTSGEATKKPAARK